MLRSLDSTFFFVCFLYRMEKPPAPSTEPPSQKTMMTTAIRGVALLSAVLVVGLSTLSKPPNYYNLVYVLIFALLYIVCRRECETLMSGQALEKAAANRLLFYSLISIVLLEGANSIHMYLNHNIIGAIVAVLVCAFFVILVLPYRSNA